MDMRSFHAPRMVLGASFTSVPWVPGENLCAVRTTGQRASPMDTAQSAATLLSMGMQWNAVDIRRSSASCAAMPRVMDLAKNRAPR